MSKPQDKAFELGTKHGKARHGWANPYDEKRSRAFFNAYERGYQTANTKVGKAKAASN